MERKKKVRLKRKDDAARNPGKKPKTVNQILPEAAEQTTAPERALNGIQEKGNDAFYFRNHAVASATGTPREISSKQSLREPVGGSVMKFDNTQA